MKSYLYPLLLALVLISGSCATSKKVPYMIDAENLPKDVLQQVSKSSDPIVMPGDLIDIIVTSVNVEAAMPFNRIGFLTQLGGTSYTSSSSNNTSNYYLVDDNGDIQFPILGTLHIGGLSKSEIQSLVQSRIYPKYLTDKPSVDIRFKNFKISILGEVAKPGEYVANNERMTLLQALAQAGDLTIMGERQNVMLIRSNADGTRSIQRLNLNDKNLILSPYYNLQQNDVIYVQPNASKARTSWTIPPALSLTLSSVGTLISIATLIVTISK